MLTTEMEAREKWCPQARIARRELVTVGKSLGQEMMAPAVVAGVNRDALGQSPNPIASCRCLGSDCMMWRWGDEPLEWKTVQIAGPADDGSALLADGWRRYGEPYRGSSSSEWFASYTRPKVDRIGFCGLAGEPRDANRVAEQIGSLENTIVTART